MRLAIALALIAACASSQAAPAAYRLDPEATFVYFEVLHFRTSTLRGRFGPLAGFVRFDAAAGTGEIGIEVATGTVDTGLKVFDERLRQPDQLAIEAYPKALFVAREFLFTLGQRRVFRAKITSSASTPSRFIFQHCAKGVKTYPYLPCTFLTEIARAIASRSAVSHRPPCSR